MGKLRIGTSGFHYDHWKKKFYPEDLPKSRWFDHYAEHFDTVEINNTFYRLPEARTFDAWRDQARPGFCYALKFSRFATHMKRLKDPEEPIARFLERAGRLGEFLGPILVQLPPRFKVVPERLRAFLAAVPSDQRWAIEFRDPSWLRPEVYAILESYGAALCIHDHIEDHPRRITASWTYLRFHGGPHGSYAAAFLAQEAVRIRRDYLDPGRDVYVYFNNDWEGYAIDNARTLAAELGKGGTS